MHSAADTHNLFVLACPTAAPKSTAERTGSKHLKSQTEQRAASAERLGFASGAPLGRLDGARMELLHRCLGFCGAAEAVAAEGACRAWRDGESGEREALWRELCRRCGLAKGMVRGWLWWSKPMGSHFGGAPPHFRTYFRGDWDVYWGCGLLTHGRISGYVERVCQGTLGYVKGRQRVCEGVSRVAIWQNILELANSGGVGVAGGGA